MHRPGRQIDPARRDDPIYMAHEGALMAREYLLTTYGLTHFEPETHLPVVKSNPNDPEIREMCDALRSLMRGAAPLGEIRTSDDVQRFRRENLGEVVVTAEEVKVTRISALLVASFSLASATIVFLFVSARTPIMFPLAVTLFIYAFYPAFSLWWAWYDTLGRRYYREYGPLSILREPTLKEALEVSGAFSVRPLSLRLAVVGCAVLALNWLHPSRQVAAV